MSHWIHHVLHSSHMGDVFFLSQLLLICVAALFLSIAERRFYNRVLPTLKNTAYVWDDALLTALHVPARAFIWFFSLSLILGRFQAYVFPPDTLYWLKQARGLMVIGVIGWFLWRFVRQIERNLAIQAANKSLSAVATTHTVGRVVRTIILVLVLVGAMQTLGVHIDGFLAVGGIGTLVIGLAGQNLLSNIFGGLMLHLDKPFRIGDWIRSADGNIEGYVQEIGWRTTHIKTLNRRPLYVPNSIFVTMAIENPSRMSHRRMQQLFGIYHKDLDKVRAILTDVRAMLSKHPQIDQSSAYLANLISMIGGTLAIMIDCYTLTTELEDFRYTQEDILLNILQILKHYDVTLAEVQKIQMPSEEIEKVTRN